MEEIRSMTEDTAKELLSTLDKIHENALEFQRASSNPMQKIAISFVDKLANELFKQFIGYSLKYAESKFWNRWYHKKKYFKAKEAMETFCIKLKEFNDQNLNNTSLRAT